MTLTYHNQLKLLHDLLDEQLIYQTSDTSEFTQIKRLVQAIMAERSIEHTPLKQYLPEIYGYGIAGERIQCEDRKSTRLNSSHVAISYAVFCLKKKIHVIVKDLKYK